VHDEFIGIGKNYHLFRLPEAVEHAAADYVQAQDEDHYSKLLDGQESALSVLQKLAGGKGNQAEGRLLLASTPMQISVRCCRKLRAITLQPFKPVQNVIRS